MAVSAGRADTTAQGVRCFGLDFFRERVWWCPGMQSSCRLQSAADLDIMPRIEEQLLWQPMLQRAAAQLPRNAAW